jgi:AraC-like DNA-binding protein
MDALSEVLRTIRLTGAVFLRAEFSAPWCISTQLEPDACKPMLNGSEAVILYHFVREGRFKLKPQGQRPVEVGAGHAVLLSRNDRHLMGSSLELAPVNSLSLVEQSPDGLLQITHGGGGAITRVLCGFLGCEQGIANTLATVLPSALTVDLGEGPDSDWMRNTLEFVAERGQGSARPGFETAQSKLSELLFVEVLRRYIEGMPEDARGWLAALRDPAVGRALALLHGQVAEDWTVEKLGRACGLSRSVLAERFQRLVGEPPMQYLAAWRMRLAAQRLADGATPLLGVAEEIGYKSEAAFIRAFRQQYGTPPAAWRRARKAAGA